MADTAVSPTPRDALSPTNDDPAPASIRSQETDSEGNTTGTEKVIIDKKKAASTTSAAPKRVSTTVKTTGSLRSRTGPPGTASAPSGLNKPPTRPSIPSGSPTTASGTARKVSSSISSTKPAPAEKDKAATSAKRASTSSTSSTSPGLKSPERKSSAQTSSTDRRAPVLNSGSATSAAPRRPPSSTGTTTSTAKASRQPTTSPPSSSDRDKTATTNRPPSATTTVSSPVKTPVTHSSKSSVGGGTAVKRLSTIQGSPSPSTTSSGPIKSTNTGHVATLKARLQNVAGAGAGFAKDVPAKEQVDLLKNRVADLEEKNKQLTDQNDALVKEQKEAGINGAENGIEKDDSIEVIAELRKRIEELEGVITTLKAEDENAKSASEKVHEETAGDDIDEEKKKLRQEVEELQTKIEKMRQQHEEEVAKLKQELVDVGSRLHEFLSLTDKIDHRKLRRSIIKRYLAAMIFNYLLTHKLELTPQLSNLSRLPTQQSLQQVKMIPVSRRRKLQSLLKRLPTLSWLFKAPKR
ncbi:hypothetical protein BDZ91DRAFT_520973 [Kalaharituber pfeilii]|nr:hypothetical protein BDZ91DRAFT_520973 [Kalaharituber pfeilii]